MGKLVTDEKPDLVIFIRDLDGTLKKNSTLKDRKKYFTDQNRVVDKKGIFLLNIFELEALIISDIQTFNRIFNSELKYEVDPMTIENPKEDLKRKCHKFNESLNPKIFKQLNFHIVKRECEYFNDFVKRLEKKLVN